MDEPTDFLKLPSAPAADPADSPAVEKTPEIPVSSPTVTFHGNGYDLSAVVGMAVGAVVLFSCATCNLGYYCLPFIPIILGIFGLTTANDSVNPQRTRLLSWLGVGAGAAIILLIALLVVGYFAFVFLMMAAGNGFSKFD